MQADLPLTAAIRQSQQTLYHSHPQHSADRQGEPPCEGQGAGPNPFWGAALFPHRGEKTGQTPPKEFFWKYIGGFAWGQVCGRDVNSLIAPPCLPAVRVSPCHSRQPSIISDASAAEGDRSSTPSDINSPRHRTHSLCNVRHYVMGGCYMEACFPAV